MGKDDQQTGLKYLRSVLRLHPTVWINAAIMATIISIVCHFERQFSTTFPGGPTWAQYMDMYDAWRNGVSDTLPDEVLLIEVAYDRDEVPVYQPGNPFPIGKAPVVSREKLLKFLSTINRVGSYRYVMLDVLFAKDSCRTEYDAELYDLIAKMPRVVIPKVSNVEMADPRLAQKARFSEYDYTMLENNFVKYPVIRNCEPSMALSMWQELNGDSVKIWDEYFATSHGRVCASNIPLHFSTWLNPISADFKMRVPDDVTFPGTTVENKAENAILSRDRVLYLGDLLSNDYKDEKIAKLIDDKIIIIGGLLDYDIHATYQGNLSGAIINYNAYQAISRGVHKISWLFVIYSFAIYYFIWVTLQCDLKFGPFVAVMIGRLKSKKRIIDEINDKRLGELMMIQGINRAALHTIFLSWIGIPTILSIFSLLSYWIFGADNFNVFWPTMIFNIGYLILYIYRYFITRRKIKKLINKYSAGDTHNIS